MTTHSTTFRQWVTSHLNLITHLVPFVLTGFALAGFFMWFALTEQPPNWAGAVAAYLGFGLFVFGASSVYHSREGQPDYKWFDELDHTAIHVLIAGTGTFHMTVLPFINEHLVPRILIYLWFVAAVGIVMRWVWHPLNDDIKSRTQYGIYILMGISAAFAIEWDAVGFWNNSAMQMTVASLVTYAVAAIFFIAAGNKESRAKRAGANEEEAHAAGIRYHAVWHSGTFLAYGLGGLAALV